jgi:outer membrane receptor protein involved in Fe transport
MKGLFRVALFSLVIIYLLGQLVWSGTTGKISGVVIDDGDKQPLPGATVQVVGTNLGTYTKVNGSYVILNVPPGTYDLKFSFVGYQEILVKGIEISADVTTTMDAKMKATAVELPTEIVRATKPTIEKGETANLRRISSADIENMTVKSVDELLSVQVGFVTKNNELHVRGGRAGEVMYIIDGVATRDPLGGLGAVRGGTNVSSQELEEVSVLKGGFDAEYGNATSAIINIVTKEGNVTSTKGSVEFITDDFGDPDLNKYSFNTDRLRLNLNGPDPLITKYLLPALGINFAGEKLSYSANFDIFKSDGSYRINDYAPAKVQKHFRSDDLLSITWPGVFSYQSGINIPERMNNLTRGSIKLTYKATPTRSLTFAHSQTVNHYTLYFNPSYETRGDIDLWNYRYTPSTIPVIDERDVSTSLSYSENLGRSSLLEVQLSRFYRRFLQLPGHQTEPGGVVYPPDFVFEDEWESQTSIQDANKNGTWDAAEPYVDINGNGRYDSGEPFEDINKGKNGVWDPGEFWIEVDGQDGYSREGGDIFRAEFDTYGDGKWDDAEDFRDTNGDGILNPERLPVARGAEGVDEAEPYYDGDIFLGEPFRDVDQDGVFHASEPYTDLYNDKCEPSPNGQYDACDPYQDLNNNGVWDQFLDEFVTCDCPANNDLNHNGKYDGPNDPFSSDMPFIPGVTVMDLNKNGKYDAPNGIWDPAEPYSDLNGNGQYDGRDGFYDRGYERRTYYQDRRSKIWTLKGSFISQIRREHEIKTGLELSYNELQMADIRYPYGRYNGTFQDAGPWPDRGIFRDFFTREPVQGAFYIRDKIEYGTMIAALGVRYDFYLQSKDITAKIEATPEPGKNEQSFVESVTAEKTLKSRNRVSPRLGMSYPVSDIAKVYFNYGHYYQLPELRFMYGRATQGSSAVAVLGNYNLNYIKTIQYELGIQYAMSEEFTLDVSGFYKDQFGLLNTQDVNVAGRNYSFYDNLDIQVDKKRGAYVNGYINYQYAYAYGKNSAEVSNYYARFDLGGVQFIPLKEYPLDWDVRHQITFNLDLRVAKGDHPKLFGVRMLDNWGINLLWQYSSGFPYTPDRTYPGIARQMQGRQVPTNYNRAPARTTVDLRMNKDFLVWKTNYSLTLYVYNLFDRRNVEQVYTTTGRPDTSRNFGGIIVPGTERDRNPLYYGSGRNIQLGISMNF